ncbi:hypothetical protein ASPZODRAFT_73446 [Penicilliopsis zonata CBS 506.65]|uniref:DEUBAD domain-containing protein n=1 Tax=Penicilliopsis zonata CBS 506.65 TaxID=1073090 RepID=A0A1L9S9I8_9EURO|nr:hypothetical protein ASPZODRAFT_73446 [Penicilliopsis zonata CBS 506.65]OJJ43825.1 hypothetical protein ASPZODRAFT_73446 [Penicilliopsis zonata CBS 506.65]
MSSNNGELARSRPKPKRNPPRSAARNPWGEKVLLTSKKSRLVDLDLVKLLARPEAWECLDEDEKKEILSLLPENVHPELGPSDEKIAPLSQSFLRYSNYWRDGIRQFQVDLQNGRYEPEWLLQASEAMEERARGEFDNFKEREFEEFWGQKQKTEYATIAGESSKVKLETLIVEGIIQIGDVWKFDRVFATKAGKIHVQKEARIVGIDKTLLTFAVPPGQRIFLPSERDVVVQDSSQPSQLDESITCEGEQKEMEVPPQLDPLPRETRRNTRSRSTKIPDRITVEIDPSKTGKEEQTIPSLTESAPTPAAGVPDNILTEANGQMDLVIVPNIRTTTAIMTQIVGIDGRIKDIPNGNAWKEFRCYRRNQDMGSLFDVREKWFKRGL